MKKIIVTIMITLVMLSALTCAQAELKFRTDHVEHNVLGVRANGETVWDSRYFAVVTSDSGFSTIIEVTEDEYVQMRNQEMKESKSAKPWYSKVAAAATFWNPND